MQDIFQLLFTALQISSVYILFSLGLTLIFGVLKVVNFAHGQFFTFGALVLSLTLNALAPKLGHGYVAYALAGAAGLIACLAAGLLVEQNAEVALRVSHYAYVMESGAVVKHGPSDVFLHDPDIKKAYLGL